MYPVPSLPPLSRRQWALRLAALGLAPGLLTPALAHEEGEGAAHHEHGHGRSQLAAGAAFAPDGGLWAVQLNAAGLLELLRSQAATPGQWLAPQLLDTGDDAIAADGESRPEIAFGPNGWVVISYTQPLPKPYTGMIRMLRSSDGGASFTPPFTVHQDRQEITHRFASIAFDADGALHTLWIDKRDQPPKGSSLAYDGAAVYRNVSHDGGASFGPDLLLAAHTCECCRIALARGADGHLRALWRHVFDGQIRDHAFAAITDAVPAQLTRATFDNWHIKACPHHGPGLAMAERGEFHAVWFGVRKLDGQDRGAVR